MNKGKHNIPVCGNCGKPLGKLYHGTLQMHADGLVFCNLEDFEDDRKAVAQ